MNETHNSDQLTKRNCSKIILLCILNLKQLLCAVKKKQIFWPKTYKERKFDTKNETNDCCCSSLKQTHTHNTNIRDSPSILFSKSRNAHRMNPCSEVCIDENSRRSTLFYCSSNPNSQDAKSGYFFVYYFISAVVRSKVTHVNGTWNANHLPTKL